MINKEKAYNYVKHNQESVQKAKDKEMEAITTLNSTRYFLNEKYFWAGYLYDGIAEYISEGKGGVVEVNRIGYKIGGDETYDLYAENLMLGILNDQLFLGTYFQCFLESPMDMYEANMSIEYESRLCFNNLEYADFDKDISNELYELREHTEDNFEVSLGIRLIFMSGQSYDFYTESIDKEDIEENFLKSKKESLLSMAIRIIRSDYFKVKDTEGCKLQFIKKIRWI